jgi:acyl-CoA synthetase (AMP-forming)/AMP-acid ligase II
VQAVGHWARAAPRSSALAHPGGRVTYRELHELALTAAGGLRGAGISAGDVVAVQLPNTLPFVVTLLAAGLLGATVQMLHMPYRRAELAALLRHGRARAFVGLDRFKEEAPVATVAQLGGPAVLVQVPGASGDETPAIVAGALSWSDLQAAGAGTAPADFVLPEPDARYVLLHTSGTTAEPKGVPVAHRQFIGNAAAALGPLQVTAQDVLLPAAPCTHLYGLFALEMGLLAGACVSLLPAFTPAALVATVRRDRVTAVFAGPAHFKPLLDQPAPPRDDFAGVRLVCLSGTAVALDLAVAVESLMADNTGGAGKVIQLWGMSELQAGTYGRPDDPPDIRLGTAGRPGPGTELRVRDDGRLQVRGPSLFDGYLDNPTATAGAFEDGWFDTGDTGRLTAEGALVLTGRTKEIINRGGVKFNPLDVETVIDRMPGVVRSAVVPMPDPVLGERACVFVQAAPAADGRGARGLTLRDVTAELEKAGIARFKWPERLETVAEMPLTPTQKIMRGRLAALLAPESMNIDTRGNPA